MILEKNYEKKRLDLIAESKQKWCVPVIDSTQGALIVFAEGPDA